MNGFLPRRTYNLKLPKKIENEQYSGPTRWTLTASQNQHATYFTRGGTNILETISSQHMSTVHSYTLIAKVEYTENKFNGKENI